MCYALDSRIADEQRAALQRFQAMEADLYARARTAIYDQYQQIYTVLNERFAAAASLFAMVPTHIELPPDLGEIADRARKAGKRPKEVGAILRPRIRAALEERFRRPDFQKSTWASRIPKTRSMLPKIERGNELDGRVSFDSIQIGRPRRGVSRIGIVLGCPWDEEHGMGLVIANDAIEEVGDSGVALFAEGGPARRKKRKG